MKARPSDYYWFVSAIREELGPGNWDDLANEGDAAFADMMCDILDKILENVPEPIISRDLWQYDKLGSELPEELVECLFAPEISVEEIVERCRKLL
jgi:hypothetical protein